MVSPIAFPSAAQAAAEDERAARRIEASNAVWLQQQQILDQAVTNGREWGERIGYTDGWHWGLLCGIAVGSVAMGMLWAAWPLIPQALAAVAEFLLGWSL